MNINLEIEYKCLINFDQYQTLLKQYFKDTPPVTQTNEYFVDTHHLLSKHLYSLRVRHLNGKLEFTLKKPEGFSKIEMNEMLSFEDYNKLIHHQMIDSQILKEIKKIGVELEDLSIETSLTTTRYEIKYLGGNLCLDKSTYSNITDYEIEYEALNEKEGLEIFKNLLSPLHITYTHNCMGKMRRALTAKTI